VQAMAVAGFFLGWLTLYLAIFQGAKILLFCYSVAFLCIKQLPFWGGVGYWRGKHQCLGGQ